MPNWGSSPPNLAIIMRVFVAAFRGLAITELVQGEEAETEASVAYLMELFGQLNIGRGGEAHAGAVIRIFAPRPPARRAHTNRCRVLRCPAPAGPVRSTRLRAPLTSTRSPPASRSQRTRSRPCRVSHTVSAQLKPPPGCGATR